MVIWKSIKEIQVMFYFFGSSLLNSYPVSHPLTNLLFSSIHHILNIMVILFRLTCQHTGLLIHFLCDKDNKANKVTKKWGEWGDGGKWERGRADKKKQAHIHICDSAEVLIMMMPEVIVSERKNELLYKLLITWRHPLLLIMVFLQWLQLIRLRISLSRFFRLWVSFHGYWWGLV